MDVLPASNTDVPAEVAQAKAAYAAPTLVRWGTLRDMTLAVGSSGGNDGGKGKQPRKTR
jgi:hypothetical protein